jgi:OOP family OmpA-OmpF porin
MNSAKVLSPLLLCAGLGLATAAQAENEGWYAVVFGGESSSDSLNQSELDAGFGLGESTLDDSDTGFGASIGYQVTEHFATELSYVDLGDATYRTNNGQAAPADQALTLEASAQGLVFALVGSLPIGERFSVFARAGIALLESEGTATASAGGVSDSASDSTQRSNGVYGLGGEFAVNDRVGVRLFWDRYADVGSAEITGEGDVDLIGLGLRINFR